MALTDETKNEQMVNNAVNTVENDVIDIKLDTVTLKRFRINGDNNAIIELNVSDMGIMNRLETGMENLHKALNEIASISDDDSDFRDKLKKADQKMREYVDYIFASPVSAVCAPAGSTMFDPKDGVYRFEAIIDGLTKLYEDNLNAEFNKIKARMNAHTAKYTAPRAGSKNKRK